MTSNYIIGLDGIPGRSGLDGNFISVKIMGNFYLIKWISEGIPGIDGMSGINGEYL